MSSINIKMNSVDVNNGNTNTNNKKPIPRFVKKAISIASLGGILFGYDMGIISGALPQIRNEFELSNSQTEMIVSFLFLGGAIGATIGGTICDKTGRKNAIFITDITFIIGSFLLFISNTFLQVIIGRLIIGFAIAISGIADVAYLYEISPSEWKGSITSVNEACISLGFLISYISGYWLSIVNEQNGWRYMFGIGSFIAFVQLVGMVYMPESPVWLNSKGRVEEAKVVLELISDSTADGSITASSHASSDSGGNDYDCCYAKDEFSDNSIDKTTEDYGLDQSDKDNKNVHHIVNAIDDNNTIIANGNSNDDGNGDGNNKARPSSHEQRPISSGRLREYSSLEEIQMTQRQQYHTNLPFNSDPNKTMHSNDDIMTQIHNSYRQVTIAIFLSIMQQFCGHPNVLNFAPEIFSQVGVPSLFSTILLGIVKFGVTCFVIWKIEYFGRKYLLLLGMSIIALSLLLLTVAFTFTSQDEEDNGNDGNLPMTMISKITAIIGIFGVAGGYACSFGPLTWLLVSELFPSSIRGRALGASTIITYIAAALVSYSFLSVQVIFGPSVPFAIYFIVTLVSICFTIVAIPDTTVIGCSSTSSSIEDALDDLWLWKKMNCKKIAVEPCERIDTSHHVV
jgi:MFS family permease